MFKTFSYRQLFFHLHKSPPLHEIPSPPVITNHIRAITRYGCFTVVIRLFSVSDYVLFVSINEYCLIIPPGAWVQVILLVRILTNKNHSPGCMGASVERLAEFCLPSSFPRVHGCKLFLLHSYRLARTRMKGVSDLSDFAPSAHPSEREHPLFTPKPTENSENDFPGVNILFVKIFHTCFIPVIARYFSEKGQNVPLYRPLCKNSSVSI